MFKKLPGVYMIKNKINNNTYIGSTNNIVRRIAGHKHALKHKIRNNLRLLNDAEKYGIDSFEFLVLEYCDTCNLKEREDFYFKLHKPSYNVWPSIYSAKNRLYTPEEKELLVKHALINLEKINSEKKLQSSKLKNGWIKRKNRPDYEEWLKGFSRQGKLHSDETKKLYSEQRKGKKKSEEMKKKLSQTRTGYKWDKVNKQWIKP